MANTFPRWVPDAHYFVQQNFINSTAYFRQLLYYSVELPTNENCSKLLTSFRGNNYEFEMCFSRSGGLTDLEENFQLQFKGNVVFSLSLRREGEGLKLWTLEDAKNMRLPQSSKALRYEVNVEPMGLRVNLSRKNDRVDVKYIYPFEMFNMYFSDYKKGNSQIRYFTFTCRRCDDPAKISIESRKSQFAGIDYEYSYYISNVAGPVAPTVITTYFSQAVTGAVQLVSNDIIEKLKLQGLPSF